MQTVADPSQVAPASPETSSVGTVRLSVIINTQRRTTQLQVAARSIFAQTGVDFGSLELVIADNDMTPSARATADALRAESPAPLIYAHEPRPGVAYARNAGVAASCGEMLAFLDDDQEAPPHWLAELLAARKRLDVDAVFSPVLGALPPGARRHRRYFEHFFTHGGPPVETVVTRSFGTGGCLVRRSALPDTRHPFTAKRNFTGGEDDALFAAMMAAGARLGWAAGAAISEWPQEARISLRYALPRAVSYGQGGTERHLLRSPPDRLGAARSMAIGASQAVILGLASGLLWLVRWPDRAFVYDKAARGLGKLLFGQRFHCKFYGLSPDERVGLRLRGASDD